MTGRVDAADQVSDAELMRRAVHGRADAFAVLFHRHADAVHNHCYRRGGSATSAQDATSLVFLEAWRRRATVVDVDGSLLPWLLGVATNTMRNQARAARRYDAALYRQPAPVAVPDPAPEIAARLDDERRVAAIAAELKRLSAAQRDVVALVILSDLSYVEAATALGVPVGTVRSRLSRALSTLRRATGSDALLHVDASSSGRSAVRSSSTREGENLA